MTATVSVRSGNIYLSAAVCQQYLLSVESVAVIVQDHLLKILPVHHLSAGGCLLKVRNAAGDRVVSAPDVLDANGLLRYEAANLPAIWSSEDAALLVTLRDV